MRRTRSATLSLRPRIAKAAIAVGIFGAVFVGGQIASREFIHHQPLPDRQVSTGRCELWLVGSSTIHRWTTAPQHFPGWAVHNRGVEGAMVDELDDRLRVDAPAQAPDAIVFYAGENDIAAGDSGSEAASQLMALVEAIHVRHPQAQLFAGTMKPSPARWSQRGEQVKFDADVHAFAARRHHLQLLEIGHVLLRNGAPGAYFVNDGIHMTSVGYERWGRHMSDEFERLLVGPARDRCLGSGANR